ncbi:hypothetical protein AVEN_189392-1 [Araneus ventricosus]|uniref:BEN domain-containing protein n=1 Tax=Araneus ventricosus TaxID=182803 RepID=A0A4Y2HAP3_ARAVE|nr:hypothetical protein AVEN_189392-1 [Araneus ventricosus]
MTGTDLFVNQPHCVAAVRPRDIELPSLFLSSGWVGFTLTTEHNQPYQNDPSTSDPPSCSVTAIAWQKRRFKFSLCEDYLTKNEPSWVQSPVYSMSSSHITYPSEEDLMCVYEKCQSHPSQFAVNLARMLFTHEELRNSNCRGVKQKNALDKQRLLFIRNAVVKFYQIPASYQTDVWKQCMQGIDTRCRQERRPKYKDIIASEFFSQI